MFSCSFRESAPVESILDFHQNHLYQVYPLSHKCTCVTNKKSAQNVFSNKLGKQPLEHHNIVFSSSLHSTRCLLAPQLYIWSLTNSWWSGEGAEREVHFSKWLLWKWHYLEKSDLPHYQKSPVTQKRVSQVGTAIPRSHNVHKRSLGEIGAKAPVTTNTCKSTVNIMVVHIKNILVMLPKSFRRKKSKMPESDRWTYSRCYFCILCVPVLLWSCLSCDSCF
jgi:hypothetical protein